MAHETNLERHYRNLSDVYQTAYYESTEVSESIMKIQGVMTEMISDLLAFQERNGATESFTRSMNRILVIESSMGLLSKINTESYTTNLINRRLNLRNIYIESRVKELEGQQNMSIEFESFDLPIIP